MKSLALAAAICFSFLVGITPAGEERYMAMRGEPPPGANTRNEINALWTGSASDTAAPIPNTTPGLNNTGRRSPPTVRYLGWKDTFSRTKIPLQDRTVEWSGKVGFNMTPRFATRQESPAHDSLLTMLIQAFNSSEENDTP